MKPKKCKSAFFLSLILLLTFASCGKTSEKGHFSTRGFYGDYKVTITTASGEYTAILSHSKGENTSVEIILN